jgi:hypothetical protein
MHKWTIQYRTIQGLNTPLTAEMSSLAPHNLIADFCFLKLQASTAVPSKLAGPGRLTATS